MQRLWRFVQVKRNREILAWLGSGAVVVAGGLWVAITHFFPPGKDHGGKPAASVQTGPGSVGIIGNVNESPITVGQPPPAAPPK